MALSLGSHLVLAASGIARPLLRLLAEGRWLSTGRPHYRDLARQGAEATALLFALGAGSGTARTERARPSDTPFTKPGKASGG
jgi:cytochrome bd ubiquinol oxidase subunit I